MWSLEHSSCKGIIFCEYSSLLLKIVRNGGGTNATAENHRVQPNFLALLAEWDIFEKNLLIFSKKNTLTFALGNCNNSNMSLLNQCIFYFCKKNFIYFIYLVRHELFYSFTKTIFSTKKAIYSELEGTKLHLISHVHSPLLKPRNLK